MMFDLEEFVEEYRYGFIEVKDVRCMQTREKVVWRLFGRNKDRWTPQVQGLHVVGRCRCMIYSALIVCLVCIPRCFVREAKARSPGGGWEMSSRALVCRLVALLEYSFVLD